jgi:hypothetical protein
MSEDTTSDLEMAYVIHYSDPSVTPVCVQAGSRTEARMIGKKARPDERISAAVREDEGAEISQTEREHLSTKENPYRFIEEVLR